MSPRGNFFRPRPALPLLINGQRPVLGPGSLLKTLLESFFHDVMTCAEEGLEVETDENGDYTSEAKRLVVARRFRALRIAGDPIDMSSLHVTGEGPMRAPALSQARWVKDRDATIHLIIFEWDIHWTPRGIVLYTGFPSEQGANWEGGGRDWVVFNAADDLELRWIRSLKGDARAVSEMTAFEDGMQMLADEDHDAENHCWVRAACHLSKKIITDPAAMSSCYENLCHLRHYISAGAILRVMRKAQVLRSEEYKLLRIREDEHLYIGANPEHKRVYLSQYWRGIHPPLAFAQAMVGRLQEVSVPLNPENCNIFVKLTVHAPEATIDGLNEIYRQIRIQAQAKAGTPKAAVSTSPPPRPTLCWISGEVVNPHGLEVGDLELAAVAEIVASVRSHLDEVIVEEYRSQLIARMNQAQTQADEFIEGENAVGNNRSGIERIEVEH